MTDEHDFFVPERVDEQIDYFARPEMRYRLSCPPAGSSVRTNARQVREARSIYRTEHELQDVPRAEARLIEDLRNYYREDRQDDFLSLERAWNDILPRLGMSSSSCSSVREHFADVQGRKASQPEQRARPGQASESAQKGEIWRWFALIIAALMLLALIGRVRSVLRVSRQERARDSFLSGK